MSTSMMEDTGRKSCGRPMCRCVRRRGPSSRRASGRRRLDSEPAPKLQCSASSGRAQRGQWEHRSGAAGKHVRLHWTLRASRKSWLSAALLPPPLSCVVWPQEVWDGEEIKWCKEPTKTQSSHACLGAESSIHFVTRQLLGESRLPGWHAGYCNNFTSGFD